MPRMVVLTCELCGVVDGAENRVATVSVAGHKVELCSRERVNLLRAVNVLPEHAEAYVEVFDQRIGTQGANPSMAQALEFLAARKAATTELGEDGGQAVAEPLVSEPVAEETGEAPPVRRRK